MSLAPTTGTNPASLDWLVVPEHPSEMKLQFPTAPDAGWTLAVDGVATAIAVPVAGDLLVATLTAEQVESWRGRGFLLVDPAGDPKIGGRIRRWAGRTTPANQTTVGLVDGPTVTVLVAGGPPGPPGPSAADGSITPAKLAPSVKDPASNVAGARTLGPGALQAATGTGQDKVGGWRTQPSAYRRWLAALGARATTRAIHVAVGDSVTEGVFGYPIDVYRRWIARYNGDQESVGWVNASPGTYALRPHRFTLTTGTAGASGGNLEVAAGLANYSYKLNVGSVLRLQSLSPTTLTLSDASVYPGSIVFYWSKQKTGAADLAFYVGGVLVKTVTGSEMNDASLATGATDSGYSWEWVGTAGGNVAVEVRATGTGTAPIFDGVYCDIADRVRVYIAGHSGQKHRDFIDNPGHLQFLAKLSPHLVTDAHGINDTVTIGGDYAALVTEYRTALMAAVATDPSFAVVAPYAAGAKVAIWPAAIEAARIAAANLGAGFIDMYALLGVAGAVDYFSDGAHINTDGGQIYARALANALDDSTRDPTLAQGAARFQAGRGTYEVQMRETLGGATSMYLRETATGVDLWGLSTLFGSGVLTLGGSGAIQFVGGANALAITGGTVSARIAPRVGTVASSATPAVNSDNVDLFKITALAVAITSMTSGLTGTPTDGQRLVYRLKDNGTARAIAWGAKFASGGDALPTTTVIGKVTRVDLEYDTSAALWRTVTVKQEP